MNNLGELDLLPNPLSFSNLMSMWDRATKNKNGFKNLFIILDAN